VKETIPRQQDEQSSQASKVSLPAKEVVNSRLDGSPLHTYVEGREAQLRWKDDWI
jgi:hypothetical protein